MRSRWIRAAISFALVCVGSASATAARAGTVDNQKTTVALTDAHVILANNTNHALTLAKGASRRLVIVTASMTAHPDTDAEIFLFLSVNSAEIVPSAPGVSSPCAGGATCTFSYTWWIDIDAEEAAHPGDFVGKPIRVDVITSANGGGTGPGILSLVAQMVKK